MTAEISWTHNVVVFEKCKDPLQREFYIRMSKRNGWTYRVLMNQISNRLYERTLTNQTNFDKNLPEMMRSEAKLAVDDNVRMKDENPSIGIILCKEKDRTIVEYALKEANKPIGIATYQMFRELPKELKNELPSPEQIALLLEHIAMK